MGLEHGNRNSKHSRNIIEDIDEKKINNCSIEEKSEHNAYKVTDKSPHKNLSNLDTDNEGDNDLAASPSLKRSSFNSSLSSKLPSAASSSSSSPTSLSQDEVLQDNKIEEGFNGRNDSTLPILKNDETGVSPKNKYSISTESGTEESLTFPIANVTNQSYQPSLTPITQSPPMQVMDRVEGYDPNRIPLAIFERNKSTSPVEWSIASTESLFSIQFGNSSFSRDRIPLGEIKLGDQVVLSHSILVRDTNNQPSVLEVGISKQSTEMRKKKKSNEINPIEMKKKKSNEISETNEVAYKSMTTTIDEVKETGGDSYEDNDHHNNDNNGKMKNEKNEENKTTSIASWDSATILRKPDAQGISKKSDASEISRKPYANGDNIQSLTFLTKKKNKCICSSFYCSNCGLAFCYCKSPIKRCNCNCASCYCANFTWGFCYCWDCTRNKWSLCGCCQEHSLALPNGVKSGSPKAIAGEQPSSTCKTSAKSKSCNWWNCFSWCPWDIFSCRSCNCSSCLPCSCCSCFSCQPCSCSSCGSSNCFSSCQSCRRCSPCSSITCSSCHPCSISSCWPSSCCCSSCHLGSNCFSCRHCCNCSSGHECSFSCSSCCPCSLVSCRPCCCSSCPPWNCSCHPCRCSCRQGRCCCCGIGNCCSCRVADEKK